MARRPPTGVPRALCSFGADHGASSRRAASSITPNASSTAIVAGGSARPAPSPTLIAIPTPLRLSPIAWMPSAPTFATQSPRPARPLPRLLVERPCLVGATRARVGVGERTEEVGPIAGRATARLEHGDRPRRIGPREPPLPRARGRIELEGLAGVLDEGGDIGADEVLALTDADDQR